VPKVKKKRMSFVIDMTPLVDITFLLLTFLMFTAQFKSESESAQTFTIERPGASADTTKLPDKDLAIIKIAVSKENTQDTSYYYTISNSKDKDIIASKIPNFDPEKFKSGMIKLDRDTIALSNFVRATKQANPNYKFAIEADKSVRFKLAFDAMNILRKNKAATFNFVTEKKKNNN
jgi:biopolymer transport protein ExbD